MMVIRAATPEEIVWDDETWIVLDIGFARSGNPSSGLGVGSAPAINMTFSQACSEIIDAINRSAREVNLVIEAPLSVAFDANGNPTARAFEVREGMNSRAWYLGPAPNVLIAGLRLLNLLSHEVGQQTDVRLVEGFATFKQGRTDHADDVEALRRSIRGEQGWVVNPDGFRCGETDSIRSLASLGAVDHGIPPVVVPW